MLEQTDMLHLVSEAGLGLVEINYRKADLKFK